MLITVFTIYVAFGPIPVVLSTNDYRLEKLFEPGVPWFVVDRNQGDSANISNHDAPIDRLTPSEILSTETPAENQQRLVQVCETKDCKIAAENFITNMDATVDPCENFYDYVCGGYPSAHPLPPTESSWDHFTARSNILNERLREILEEEIDIADLGPVKSAKRAYKACMDTDAIERKGIEPILSIIDQNGGWPIMMDTSLIRHGRKMTWQQIEANYSREYGTSSIYEIMVDVDLKNASSYAVYLDQGSTILPRSIIVDGDKFSTVMSDYAKYIEDVAYAFAKVRRPEVSRERIAKDAKDIAYFETEIAKISSSDEMRRDIDRLYNPMTIEHLQSWYNRGRLRQTSKSKLNWLKTFQNQFNDLKINIEITERIVVLEIDYFFKLASLLQRTPRHTIVNYIHWRMVSSFLSAATKQFKNITFEMEKKLFGVREQRERWMTCVTDNEMRHAISYQYVNKFVTDDAKNAASEMVTEIQEELAKDISHSSWMDESTKTAAKDKLHSMKRFISHPDWYQNQTAMIHYYKGLVVTEDYFENTVNFKNYDRKKRFRKYRTPVEKNVWPTEPITINAFYDPSMNSLTFPAGILQIPFFSVEVLDSLNYGSIGAVIGHEISHGFDDVGRQFDKDGNAKQWWSDSTIKAFTERAQCFIDQYNNYTIDELSTAIEIFHGNGESNQGENIADATGLEASYGIFKKRSQQRNGQETRLIGLESFTQDQLFFIAYANTWCETVTKEYLAFIAASDSHSTNRLRVIGTIGNSEGFSKAFNCPAGSPMNRNNKCNLWK